MKAIQIRQYGDFSNLQEVEIEKPGIQENQVLIKISASAVNPIDIKLRTGFLAAVMPKNLPFTLGWEAAGTITEVGSDVSGFKVGDEVYTMPNFMQGGTYAEYVAVNATEIALKPRTLSFLQAATVPMVAGAAYTSLMTIAQISQGQKVLIHGAAGAVGSFAVQLAKSKGAYVIGTAQGAGIDLIKSLGADEVVDYTKVDFANSVSDLDVVLDLVGGETLAKSYGLVKKGGIVVSAVMPTSQEQTNILGIRGVMAQTPPDGKMFSAIATLIDGGKLKVQEPVVYSLAEAQKAHQAIENRTAKGKIVFQIA